MAPRKRAAKSPPKQLPTLPPELWAMIFELSDPQALTNIRQVCWSFNILLTDLQRIWVTARKRTFGEDCPDPPLGLTEFQYATLIFAGRCQERGCKNAKATRVCWAMQKRLCRICFTKRTVLEDRMVDLCSQFPRIDNTLLDFCYIKYKHLQYTYTGDTLRPQWAGRMPIFKGYDSKAVKQRLNELAQLPVLERLRAIEKWVLERRGKITRLRLCEKFFLELASTTKRQS